MNKPGAIQMEGYHPAFPSSYTLETGAYDRQQDNIVPEGSRRTYIFEGMSLRDYFAAKALIALLAIDVEKWPHNLKRTDSCSAAAYEMADAMLKARKE